MAELSNHIVPLDEKQEPTQKADLKAYSNDMMTKGATRKRRAAAIAASDVIKQETKSRQSPPQQKKRKKKEYRRIIPNKSMPIIELFFASLLKSSSYNDFLRSNEDEEIRNKILSEACSMINLPLPGPLPSIQTTKAEFYNTRAALVLEESRAILSTSVTNLDKDVTKAKKSSMILSFIHVKHLKSGNLSLIFERSDSYGLGRQSRVGFSPDDLCTIKPGCCFELIPLALPGDQQQELTKSIISPISQLDSPSEEDGIGEDTRLGFMCFQQGLFDAIEMMPPGTKWSCRPLTSLIGQLRQFEVCMKAPHVEFLPSLLGVRQKLHGTHIRFYDTESCHDSGPEKDIGIDNKLETNDTAKDTESSVLKTSSLNAANVLSLFQLPALNPVQQGVIDAFLSSKSTLSVVQGPPGTGKTELIVSLLFRSIAKSQEHRTMVCAPTNKVSNKVFIILLDHGQPNLLKISILTITATIGHSCYYQTISQYLEGEPNFQLHFGWGSGRTYWIHP